MVEKSKLLEKMLKSNLTLDEMQEQMEAEYIQNLSEEELNTYLDKLWDDIPELNQKRLEKNIGKTPQRLREVMDEAVAEEEKEMSSGIKLAARHLKSSWENDYDQFSNDAQQDHQVDEEDGKSEIHAPIYGPALVIGGREFRTAVHYETHDVLLVGEMWDGAKTFSVNGKRFPLLPTRKRYAHRCSGLNDVSLDVYLSECEEPELEINFEEE